MATTDELPALVVWKSVSVFSGPGAISGCARPVVLTESERELLRESGDPTALRERFQPPHHVVLPDGGDPVVPGCAPSPRTPLALVIAGRLMVAILAILVVASGIAVAAR
jgi:hypothetical protein